VELAYPYGSLITFVSHIVSHFVSQIVSQFASLFGICFLVWNLFPCLEFVSH
jgi:hypothetical protein